MPDFPHAFDFTATHVARLCLLSWKSLFLFFLIQGYVRELHVLRGGIEIVFGEGALRLRSGQASPAPKAFGRSPIRVIGAIRGFSESASDTDALQCSCSLVSIRG
jgi:hypothetical protein